MSNQKEIYNKIATAIIQKQAEIIGSKIAIKKAEKVPQLVLDDQGEVFNLGLDPIVTLGNLVKEYMQLSGSVAINFSKEAISNILLNNPGIELPTELQ
ncbi:hypothetical protein A2X44_04845 [candidate division CPR3 bacterium GWF2_35_18]|uniref:Uncharacterized protein n=1 Tax=candidate division CPR3 bacterium GW2011_GWF2_35_18 TaxID=1618350 RepID=A0A0G0ER58_UNCC3|nr:MAG: hypothetical protein UR67_C0003G0050 [candidate division CPR3 bacterium GW2011_GWF2_35_18]KKP86920.1 MAG: hypothetical protein UR87_C0008G0011 [candidate division CPR3 bacterium GW2011_GWE2_35_7]OGB63661.1 MAG: hypothetical protein A2X44_04845 [candidate division CPR3 bacterium GWF2_35_18]OGB65018.1 MAG: hypothetical protein A2250_01195 [candidate division CPR3 bacterium RIFOXYA2_FULL_35_13]OGB76018.1 MAG: hypothetical protein A2476_02145 [candidate division CPR3 bacterium RIFOXYC2_FULL